MSRALVTLALAVLTTAGAYGQPSTLAPLRILVGFGAGGTTDVIARTLATNLTLSLGRRVVVEDRPGAGGRIAAAELKGAPADGSVIMLAPVVVPVIAPLIDRKPNYDPASDFAPVTQLATYTFGIAVAQDHPARTVTEFVEWAKADPARAFFGTVSPGGLPHFIGLKLGYATGVSMTHVAYSGPTPIASDLMGGRLPMWIDALSNLIVLHRAGKLRIIAVSSTERSPLLPDVPTFKEQGLATVEAHGWIAAYVPAKTPKLVVERLSAAMVMAVQMPTVRERFIGLGLEPTGTTPEELAAIMAADSAYWGPIIKASGFSTE